MGALCPKKHQNKTPKKNMHPLKDSMRYVYELTSDGWIRVMECQSFDHACKEAIRAAEITGREHCVNSFFP